MESNENIAYLASEKGFRKNLTSFDLNKNIFKVPDDFPEKLFMKGGIPLSYSKSEKKVFVDSSDNHSLIIGSTGSKKSRLFVMPLIRILSYAEENMIISDPKGEIYNRTAKSMEKLGYCIQTLNFRQLEKSSSWNPLFLPYKIYLNGDIDRAYEYANDICENIMKTEISVKDPYWDNAAADLCYGLILLLFKICKEKNLSMNHVTMENIIKLRRQLFSNELDGEAELWKYAKNDDLIYASLSGIYNNASTTRNCILSMFDSKVRIFTLQKNLLDMMSSMTIDIDRIIEDLSCNKKTAIYLIMPDEKTSYNHLIALFIKQSYEYILQKIQEKTQMLRLERRLNYVLDEFSSLPKINDFTSMITAARSRNIRFHLVIQSKNQLKSHYAEEAETIQSNCMNWIFLTSRELDLLKEVSTLCGEKSNGTPLLSVFRLQHFNKENGETLILSGRSQPLISEFPDISQYDKDDFKPRELTDREYVIVEPINFSNILEKNVKLKKGVK